MYTADAEQRVGTAHAIANNVAMACFTGSWFLRRRGGTAAGVGAGLAGSVVAGASAFLGGHLSYRRGVGVNTTAFQSGPEVWTDVTLDSELLTGQPVRGTIGEMSFVVIRDDVDGTPVRIMESRCTHRGAPLHDGTVIDGCIVCPWHDSRFDLVTGAVVAGPASIPQPVYDVRLDGDTLMIRRREVGGLRGQRSRRPTRLKPGVGRAPDRTNAGCWLLWSATAARPPPLLKRVPRLLCKGDLGQAAQ